MDSPIEGVFPVKELLTVVAGFMLFSGLGIAYLAVSVTTGL